MFPHRWISFNIDCLIISLTKDLQCERKKVRAQKQKNAKGKAVQAELRNARNTIAKLRKEHKINIRKMMRSQHYQKTRKALFSVIKTFIFHQIRLAFKTWETHTRVCKRTIMCIEVRTANFRIYIYTHIFHICTMTLKTKRIIFSAPRKPAKFDDDP